MSCPICGKQSLSNFTPYCRNHVNIMWKSDINTIEESVLDKYVSVEELKYTEDKLASKLETLNKENLAMTDGWTQIKLLDTELHIKYKIKKD